MTVCSATSASKVAARLRLGRQPLNTRCGRGTLGIFAFLFFKTALSFTSFPVAVWPSALVASSLIHSGGNSSPTLVLAIGRSPLLGAGCADDDDRTAVRMALIS